MHHNLTHCLTVPWHIVHVRIDDPCAVSNHIALTLPGEEARLLCWRKVIPFRVPFADSVGAVGFSQAIDVNRAEVEYLHLSK